MDWTWDDRKAELNYAKHGVLFATAAVALLDPLSETTRDDHPTGDRWRTLAVIDGKLLFIVHTEPDIVDDVPGRIISARPATPAERRLYEQ